MKIELEINDTQIERIKQNLNDVCSPYNIEVNDVKRFLETLLNSDIENDFNIYCGSIEQEDLNEICEISELINENIVTPNSVYYDELEDEY